MKNAAPPPPYINIRMTDLDIIEKVAKLLNKKVNKTTPSKSAKKPLYACNFKDRGTVYYFVNQIYPFLSIKRKKEVDLQLDYIEQWKNWFNEDGRSRKQFIKKKFGD